MILMLNKKSQITIFIIIGIIILMLVSLILYSNHNNFYNDITKLEDIPVEFRPIKLFMDSCFKEVTKEAIELAGRQGGYIIAPDNSISFYFNQIPLYFNKDQNLIISKKEIENQVSIYLNHTINRCLSNFSMFNSYNLSYNNEFSSSIMFGDEDLAVKIHYPITIIKQDSVTKITNFLINLPVRLNYIYNTVDLIVKKQVKDNDKIDLTYLSDFDLNITLFAYNETVLIYSLTDTKSYADDESFNFIFAGMFGSINSTKNNIEKLELNKIPNFSIPINKLFVYDVETTIEDNIEFSAITTLFDIDPKTGLIVFIPTKDDIGKHYNSISVIDKTGQKDYQTFEIEVYDTKKIKIDSIPNFDVIINETFFYNVNAIDKNNHSIYYLANTNLENFIIDPELGIINFKPEESQIGVHQIEIVAVNTNGESDKNTFYLTIKNE
jgi:hypothetical protein